MPNNVAAGRSIPINFRTTSIAFAVEEESAFREFPQRQSGPPVERSIHRFRGDRYCRDSNRRWLVNNLAKDKSDVAIDRAVSTGILAMEGKQSNI